ncbi:hypothetical protein [Aeromonas veronii]|uniref:hypothetical protein n=1 Tax=Aeromonas veronii TaxID=654 RepID=UPI0007BAF307|nr:hypothetical protein [Aeromonas veronii]KZW95744.1 hypothetical protein WM54_14055 [Aeromonas veronii]
MKMENFKLIIRIGSRVVDAKEIARPVENYKKDDIVTWAGAKCVVDYVNNDTLALQMVTYP